MAANTIFATKTIIASLLAIGIAGAAQAQAPSTFNITGHVPGQQVGNIAGGGSATLSGGGDDLSITYSAGGAGGGGVLSQSGRFARFASTHGDGLLVEYGAPADTNPGREAWITGGGDNAEVVYTSPYQRR
jgi:hypothetical protein